MGRQWRLYQLDRISDLWSRIYGCADGAIFYQSIGRCQVGPEAHLDASVQPQLIATGFD